MVAENEQERRGKQKDTNASALQCDKTVGYEAGAHVYRAKESPRAMQAEKLVPRAPDPLFSVYQRPEPSVPIGFYRHLGADTVGIY
jgi:hypothetical protein